MDHYQEPPARQQNNPRHARLGALLILLLAAILRLYRLAGQSLWSDEGNSISLAKASLAEISARTALDIHPPLYYWLLHLWMQLFGDSEVAVRSLSVLCSLLLVAVIYRLARRLFGFRTALLAGFLAAISPFQIHYAQETRMYAMLSLLGGLAVLATAEMIQAYDEGQTAHRSCLKWALVYVAAAVLGLYTHYAFPVVLAATGLAGLLTAWRPRRQGRSGTLVWWIGLNLAPVVLYIPWLPIAWRQLTTWPAPDVQTSWISAAGIIWHTLALGPTAKVSAIWMFLLGMVGLLGVVHLLRHHRPPVAALTLLYLVLPAALTLFLFKPAYLKFLLVAAPAYCFVLALAPQVIPAGPNPANRSARTLATLAVIAIAAAAAWQPLHTYYTDPAAARDDYRRIARYVAAAAGEKDAVLLNAAGQAEVFGYYYTGEAPVYPLPEQRPLDPVATLHDLEQLADRSRNIFAVYWATDESDPQGLIEGWLNAHTFKANDVWFGNVRLVTYAAPLPLDDLETVDARFADLINLTGYRVTYPHSSHQEAVVLPGDIIQIQLCWQAETPVPEDYVVFLQALDAADHLVGQRDAPPINATSTWTPGEAGPDRHGLFILPGAPPGEYRLVLGLYDPTNGQRLPIANKGATKNGDALELGRFTIARPSTPPPVEALTFRHALGKRIGPFFLLGYDQHRLGHSYEPDTPLSPGAPLHVVVSWQTEEKPSADWKTVLTLTRKGENTSLAQGEYPVAGIDYPTSFWQAGEIVRAQYDLWLPADLAAGSYTLKLTLSDGESTEPADGLRLLPFTVN